MVNRMYRADETPHHAITHWRIAVCLASFCFFDVFYILMLIKNKGGGYPPQQGIVS